MIYGRFVDFSLLILLPACILILNREAESLQVDDLTNVASASNSVEAGVDVVSHAFVQTDSELHYFRDVSHQEILLSSISDLNDRQVRKFDLKKLPKNVALFESDATDFGSVFIGVPTSRKIFVVNPTNSKLIFTAITSAASAFHCSFPVDKVLEPQQRTNFTVLFLPTKEGLIEDFVVVHTSIGKISHKVRGNVVGNPYRLRSFFGIKLPLNGTFVAPVAIHNPHLTIMKVVEVFSSDSNVQIEVTENSFLRTAPSKIWEIAPFETRNIFYANILGNVERNATLFIYVKYFLMDDHMRKYISGDNPAVHTSDEEKPLNSIDEIPQKQLVISMEIQVTRRQGIFSTDNIFDFGMIKHGETSKQFTFRVYSNIEKGVEIESIYDLGVRGVYMQFASKPPLSIKCGARNQPGAVVAIASINYGMYSSNKDDLTVINEKLFRKRGTIIAESRGGNYNVTVPYEALIYHGEMLMDSKDVAFHSKLKLPVSRSVQLTNNFSFPLAIWDVSMAANGSDAFQVQLINPIVVLSPLQTLPVLLIKYVNEQISNFSTHFTIHTNISSFDLPIFVFDGKLEIKLNSLKQNSFDFGYVAEMERRSIQMTIVNHNPISITIDKLQNPLPLYTKLEFERVVHLEKSSEKTTSTMEIWSSGMDFILPANSFVVFNYSLVTPHSNHSLVNKEPHETVVDADFVLRTSFDEFHFPVHFQLTSMQLASIPQVISFHNCFIGTVHSKEIKIHSFFDEDLAVHRLSLSCDDSRFFLSKVTQNTGDGIIIKAGSSSSLGRLSFVPEASCLEDPNSNECYVGIPLDTTEGQWFTYGLNLPQNLAEIDRYLYGRLRRKWAALNTKIVNTTLLLDTSKVKNFEIPVQASLAWPRLLSHPVVHFPLTAVGNFTIVNLTLTNPSRNPVIVQLLPLVIYPDAEAMLEFFRGEFPAPLVEPVEMNETLMFSLRDTELFTLRPGSPVPKLREELEKVINAQVPRFTLSMILKPGMRTRVRIGFLPSDYTLRSSLLLIRNNLTGIEPVVLYGQGAQIRMEIDNKTARSSDALVFDIQPSHLADCQNPKRLLHKLTTTLTVKRSFYVKNTGDVTFSVVNMSISNMPCENRGFRILNCSPFRLEPNEIAIIDIAYTPDFLMAVNDASLQLYMHMNGTPWVFDLSASLPRHMLAMCHAALPRPAFEGVMYYTCVLALMFCLICIISCSYLEADRIISCAIRQLFIDGTERKVFDLNSAAISRTNIPKIQRENTSSLNCRKASTLFNLGIRKLWPKPVRYRNYVHVAPDAGFLSKMIFLFANNILWFFSYFWLFIRNADDVFNTCIPVGHNSTNEEESERRSSQQPNDSEEANDEETQPVSSSKSSTGISIVPNANGTVPLLPPGSVCYLPNLSSNLSPIILTPVNENGNLKNVKFNGQNSSEISGSLYQIHIPSLVAQTLTTNAQQQQQQEQNSSLFNVMPESSIPFCIIPREKSEQQQRQYSVPASTLELFDEKKSETEIRLMKKLKIMDEEGELNRFELYGKESETSEYEKSSTSEKKKATTLKKQLVTSSLHPTKSAEANLSADNSKSIAKKNGVKNKKNKELLNTKAGASSESNITSSPCLGPPPGFEFCNGNSMVGDVSSSTKFNNTNNHSINSSSPSFGVSGKKKKKKTEFSSSQSSTQSSITRGGCEFRKNSSSINGKESPIGSNDDMNRTMSPLLNSSGYCRSPVSNGTSSGLLDEMRHDGLTGNNESDSKDRSFGAQSDDGSVVPEWAESVPIISDNIDEEFGALAINTAALAFDDSSEHAVGGRRIDTPSPLSSSSLSSYMALPASKKDGTFLVPIKNQNKPKFFQRTPRRPTTTLKQSTIGDGEDTTAESSTCPSEFNNKPKTSNKRRKKLKYENMDVEHYIGKLTRDYRERLKHLFASGELSANNSGLVNDPNLLLPLPMDFAAKNTIKEETAPWLNATQSVFPLSPIYPTIDPSLIPPAFTNFLPSRSRTSSPPPGYASETLANSTAIEFTNSASVGVIGEGSGRTTGSVHRSNNDPFSCDNLFNDMVLPTTTSGVSSSNALGLLFNSNDPIWKPIFEESNEPSASQSYWPIDFLHGPFNSENNKKSKND